jgi:hypothetical protein
MAATIVFVAICMGGVVFLTHVFVALWREDRLSHAKQARRSPRSPVVVQLPPDPIYTAHDIHPSGVPQKASSAIPSNTGRTIPEFYVDEYGFESIPASGWRIFVNPKSARVTRVKGVQ